MNINILLFDDFETLDAFGPIEILSKIDEYKLSYYSFSGGVIVSAQGTSILTERIDRASREGILVIPGGRGTRTLVNDTSFLQALKEAAVASAYCLSICTGAALLAKTGLLNHRKATTNKLAFDWVVSVNPDVNWIRKARWVIDGKYYTSSGVSAGMDMTLGFIKDRFGADKARDIAKYIEYVWNEDGNNDLFAIP